MLALQEAQARGVLECASSTKHMRFIANAAGGLLPLLAQQLQNTFHCTILTSYGMTEW